MKLSFIGATDDVTGSMTLLETPTTKILIDCGLYQGISKVIKKNLHPLPFDPKDLDAIILTHAHLDHSGRIPHLVKRGFRGSIFCTKATMKLARVIMTDSAHILEKTEHHPLRSFYAMEDVMVATSLFKTKKLHETFSLKDLTIHLFSAGHILGAASVHIQDSEQSIVFSGDIGRSNDPLISPPESCPQTDLLVMESTYGGKIRKGDIHEELISFLKYIKKESKIGIIASFAVARSQLLITLIHQFYLEHPEEKIRFVIDGPMMIEANKIYKEFAEETNLPLALKHALEEVEVIEHVREWESIKKKVGPLIIISSSGMISGGRIWRYLENWQDDGNACLFLPGYQAIGTAGRDLIEGKRIILDEEGKKIHWQGEVHSSSAFSSHADQDELLAWIKNISKDTTIYLNHGEMESKQKFMDKLKELGHKKVYMAQP
ncbi:MAG: MBL fold metallo-hydrolase [Bacteriovorax sp.]|jgi:metallo-beta-lactamase family protein|nr:MBL fold metallo-hydrolase [Bacteriovorax sp.]